MPYFINNTNGDSLVTLQDGSIDQSTTSLTLVGKNFPTFGQYLNQNFISLLENFANDTQPDPALKGQIWYDSSTKNVKFYREGSTTNNWQKLANTSEGITAPLNPRLGDLWWDTNNSQLKLYDSVTSIWRVIGPQTTTEGKLRVIGTNSFDIQVGGNSVLTIDEYGGVNTPLNALVSGFNSASTLNLTTPGITQYITWTPLIKLDVANNFNYTTGVFTVRTTGYYRVDAYVTSLGGGEVRLSWRRNNVTENITASVNIPTIIDAQVVCGGVMYASVGDSIQLVYSTATGASISNRFASYSIQLIG